MIRVPHRRARSSTSRGDLPADPLQQGHGLGDAAGGVGLEREQRVDRCQSPPPRPARGSAGCARRRPPWWRRPGLRRLRPPPGPCPPVTARPANLPRSRRGAHRRTAASKPTRSSTRSIPGRSVAPSSASAREPRPAGGPGPRERRAGRAPVVVATTSAQRVSPALQPAYVRQGSAPFCGPNTAAAPPGSEERVVHVAGDDHLDPVQRPEPAEVEPGDAARERRRRARAPAPSVVEQAGAERLDQARAAVGGGAAAEPQHHANAHPWRGRRPGPDRARTWRRRAGRAGRPGAGPARRPRRARPRRARRGPRTARAPVVRSGPRPRPRLPGSRPPAPPPPSRRPRRRPGAA